MYSPEGSILSWAAVAKLASAKPLTVQQDQQQRNMLLNYQLWRKCVWEEYMI